MNKFNYTNLTPFKWFVLENFPFIEADFDALTEWQLFCKLGKEINKIINSTNTLGIQVESLTDYVKNYFDNLDVQEEINNKLNKMTEDGTLQEIITSYLKLKGLLCYNTLNDLKNATNLINGSFAKTYGLNQYNDGKGEFYKIRNILNTDVVDNINIIALNNFDNLIAEKIPNYYLNILQNDVNLIKNDVNLIKNKKYLLVGDSYGEGYSPDGNVESWCIKFKRILGLTDNECKILVRGGYGFGRRDKYFPDLIQTIADDPYITDIIVLCGYNDIGASYENINTGINEFKTICKQKFPNALLKIGFVGWSNNPSKIYNLSSTCINYINICKNANIPYLNNMEFTLHDYFKDFSSDDFHPNEKGQAKIASNLVNAINTGDANVLMRYTEFEVGLNYDFTSNTNFKQTITMSMKNENILFSIKNIISLDCKNKKIICNNTLYDVADITGGLVIGSNYYTTTTTINTIVKNGDNFYNVPAILVITDKRLKIGFYCVNPQNNNYFFMNNVSQIMIQPTSFYIDAKIN